MCTRPIIQDENTFACRTCDECIATRRHGWVARAMAEKTDWPHVLCIALTYSDDTEIGRQGSRMFCYADVAAFLKRVRDALRRADRSATLRFLCAGEQGSRNGRCHWHLIIYSALDLTSLGAFSGLYGPVTNRADMLTVGKRKRRLNWSLWPYGFVTLQEPDQGGMAYVLSYCLKDQFTEEKSKGTMREAQAENFATGLFRMSKRPAIGENFLMRKMEALEASGAVLPALNIKVPDFGGYWQPSGTFRKKLLWCLVALNKRILWATGADAPQWPALLASCADNPPDLEILNGTVQEKTEEHSAASLERSARFNAGEQRTRETRRKCGSSVPCVACLNNASEAELHLEGFGRYEEADGYARYFSLPGWPDLDARRRQDLGRENPLCQLRGSKENRRAFPASGGAAP